MKIGIAGQHTNASHLLTDSHASAAQDAKIVVSVKERLS
jgi:hypothetical protein